MKLLEYEGKQLLQRYGLPVAESQLIAAADEAPVLTLPLMLKVQIPKGGRGKAGGVRLVRTEAEFHAAAQQLLAEPMLGCNVTMLLAEAVLAVEREFYISIALDRDEQSLVLLAHKNGGVDIEEAVKSGKPLRVPLSDTPDETTVKKVQEHFELSEDARDLLRQVLMGLWTVCTKEDAILVEINPLIATRNGELVCGDAKIELDNAASFRHPEWSFEEKQSSAQFVELAADGTIASMANGAGLAMATIDAIKAAGAEPANFFDVGGGTDTAGMVKAFEKISAMPQVRAIVINIFGGITRCDEVARAVIAAREHIKDLPALFIRLTGTNEKEGKELLAKAHIPLLPTLAECVSAAAKEVRRV